MALEGWSHQTTQLIQDGNWRSGVEGLIAVQIPAGKNIKKERMARGMAAQTLSNQKTAEVIVPSLVNNNSIGSFTPLLSESKLSPASPL